MLFKDPREPCSNLTRLVTPVCISSQISFHVCDQVLLVSDLSVLCYQPVEQNKTLVLGVIRSMAWNHLRSFSILAPHNTYNVVAPDLSIEFYLKVAFDHRNGSFHSISAPSGEHVDQVIGTTWDPFFLGRTS
jgi:hypothetical protein